MARLPHIGGDDGNWGTVLNDYLSQELNSDGSLKIRTDGTLSGKYVKPVSGIPKSDLEASVQTSLDRADTALTSSQRGVANGVASLDGNGTIPTSQLGVVATGMSLATITGIPDVTAFNGGDWPGGLSPTITIPASGRIFVEGHTPWLVGSVVGAAWALTIYEAPVVNGLAGTFVPIAGDILHVNTINKGQGLHPAAPLERQPGLEFVYKLVIGRVTGTGTASTSGLGGPNWLTITAR